MWRESVLRNRFGTVALVFRYCLIYRIPGDFVRASTASIQPQISARHIYVPNRKITTISDMLMTLHY